MSAHPVRELIRVLEHRGPLEQGPHRREALVLLVVCVACLRELHLCSLEHLSRDKVGHEAQEGLVLRLSHGVVCFHDDVLGKSIIARPRARLPFPFQARSWFTLLKQVEATGDNGANRVRVFSLAVSMMK